MDPRDINVELQRKRNITYAKWVKEVALLFLAALVVQNVVHGASVFSITVITGVVVSGALYYFAYYLASKGHDTRAIQDYLGHKNIQYTVRYTAMAPHRFESFWDD